VTNLIGNCVATVVVAAWERDIDQVRAHRVLDRQPGFDFVPETAAPHGDGPVAGAAAI